MSQSSALHNLPLNWQFSAGAILPVFGGAEAECGLHVPVHIHALMWPMQRVQMCFYRGWHTVVDTRPNPIQHSCVNAATEQPQRKETKVPLLSRGLHDCFQTQDADVDNHTQHWHNYIGAGRLDRIINTLPDQFYIPPSAIHQH